MQYKGETKQLEKVVIQWELLDDEGGGIGIDRLVLGGEDAVLHQHLYDSRDAPVSLYGGLITVNIVQGEARCVVAEQMHAIAKK